MNCKIKRYRKSIADRKDYENALASIEKQKSDIEFIAIMADIPLDDDEEEIKDGAQ